MPALKTNYKSLNVISLTNISTARNAFPTERIQSDSLRNSMTTLGQLLMTYQSLFYTFQFIFLQLLYYCIEGRAFSIVHSTPCCARVHLRLDHADFSCTLSKQCTVIEELAFLKRGCLLRTNPVPKLSTCTCKIVFIWASFREPMTFPIAMWRRNFSLNFAVFYPSQLIFQGLE